jgi:hypothetical protein
MDFLLAVKLSGRSAEEYDPDWILLDLVKCLESQGNLHNGLKNISERCENASNIIHALNIYDSHKKAVIKEAYKIRSMRAAHSPKNIPIYLMLVEHLRKLDRQLILNFLETIN